MPEPVRIDLGCGSVKREGYVGLDYVAGDQVDHVLDLTHDRYPFADASVDEVFSAHFLEHIETPNHVFGEIARICRDGARIEFWTPYAFTEEAFLYGHLHRVTEEMWRQFCVSHRDSHAEMLGGRWLLHRIVYVIAPGTADELAAHRVDLDFAVRHFKDVVIELGVEIEFRSDLGVPAVVPERVFATSRFGVRSPLLPNAGRHRRSALVGRKRRRR
jgi:SAM-dependent methyltransferase